MGANRKNEVPATSTCTTSCVAPIIGVAGHFRQPGQLPQYATRKKKPLIAEGMGAAFKRGFVDEKKELVLPYPPSVNHYWMHTGRGCYLGKRGKIFRAEVAFLAHATWGDMVLPFTGRLSITIVAHPPDNRRRDVDNILKALLDALQHAGVYKDDNQVKLLTVGMGDVDKANPRVVVSFSGVPNNANL